MPTPIQINVNFIDLTGNAIPGYMEAAIVPATGIYDLFVSGLGIIAPKVTTSATGTSVSVSVWGNDVIVDASDNAMDTYYSISLFQLGGNLIWQAAYLFTGSGPINLVGYPILNPVPAPPPFTQAVTYPPGGASGDVQYNNGGLFGGSNSFNFNSGSGVVTAPIFNATTGFQISGAATAGNFLRGNGTNFVSSPIQTGDIPAGALVWNNIGNATGNLVLNNTTYTTQFQQSTGAQWLWANITAATSGANQSSPYLELAGTYWTGSASAFDDWTLQDVVGTGTNPVSTFALSHSGSSGAAIVSLPNSYLSITSQNLGPTNVPGTVLALSNTTGTSTAYITKDGSGNNSLTIRNDSALIQALGAIEFNGVNGTLTLSGGSNGPVIALQTTAVSPMQVGSVLVTTNQSGAGLHGMQLSNGSNTGLILDTDSNVIHYYGTTSGVAVVGAAAVAGTPNPLNWPTTTGTSGQVLSTNGANPQQLSWVNGTTTIASGTATLGTSAIASGTAASTVTVSATGVLSTDNVMADFNSNPTGVVGYEPSASGMLTIIKYCSAGNVNFIVVNNTGSSITPGAITLNWRVVR